MAELNLELWPRQLEAFETNATEYLFGGSSRGGKSHFVRVALVAWCLGIPKLQCVLIRKKFDDILSNHVNGPSGFRDLLSALTASGQARVTQDAVTFSNGSMITFKHCQDERQFDSAQGVGTHVLVVDEATQIGERLLRFFRGWVTMPNEMKESLPDWAQGRFPRIIYTANPIGPSVPYFRRYFVEARKPFEMERVGAFIRQYIPSLVTDNPSEDAEAARGRLMEIGDTALATALIEGDWHALQGDYFPEWNEDRHVVASFTPPSWWFRFRSMDLGYAEPFACYWIAVSDGEVFHDSQGRERWFPRGSFIFYREWYGCDATDSSRGLRMRNEDIAAGIYSRSDANERSVITLTDSLPFQDRGGLHVPKVFADNGVPIVQGDTSRVIGWNQMRARLIGQDFSGERVPLIYFTDDCTAARDYIPALTRHPSETKKEDAQEHGEATHSCFVAGTMVQTPQGQRAIESLIVGDKVIAGDGVARKISDAGLTRRYVETIRLKFDDGSSACCTPDHEFLTEKGWLRACDAVGLSCMVDPCALLRFPRQFKSSTASNTSYIQKPTISDLTSRDSTAPFGNITTDLFRKAVTFTTRITTDLTTRSRIWNWWIDSSIYRITAKLAPKKRGYDSINTDILRAIGTSQKRVESGTANITQDTARSYISELIESASIAAKSLRRIITQYSALAVVSRGPLLAGNHFTSTLHAYSAERYSKQASIGQQVRAVKVARSNGDGRTIKCVEIAPAGKTDVYCLTEPVTHSFKLANGVIVSNCDAIRLACMAHTIIKDRISPMQSRIDDAMRMKPSIKNIINNYESRAIYS